MIASLVTNFTILLAAGASEPARTRDFKGYWRACILARGYLRRVLLVASRICRRDIFSRHRYTDPYCPPDRSCGSVLHISQ